MPVGTVAQHLEGSIPANLQFQKTNRVTLIDQGGDLGVDLFFQPSIVSPSILSLSAVH